MKLTELHYLHDNHAFGYQHWNTFKVLYNPITRIFFSVRESRQYVLIDPLYCGGAPYAKICPGSIMWVEMVSEWKSEKVKKLSVATHVTAYPHLN